MTSTTRWDDLLAVQDHDTTVDQLSHRRRTLPARAELDAAMAQLAALEETVAAVEAHRHDLARDQQRLEDEIGSLTEKAAASDKALYGGTVSNPRQLQALQEEIEALTRRIRHLEDQELEIMEQLEPLDAELAEHAERRGALDAEAARLQAAIAEAEGEIDQELASVRAERQELAAAIEPGLLAEYETLRRQLGGIAIARLVGGTCGGCHLSLPAVEVDRIKHLSPDEPVRCEECGRLLAR